MVEGVNFNPFTNKLFTVEEIEQLDGNKDGIVSNEELEANISWLSSTVDEEGEVDFSSESSSVDDNNSLVDAAQKAGMSQSANSLDELKNNIAILTDEYTEMYFSEHRNLSSAERNSVISKISLNSDKFINEYITENPNGPYDMSVVAASFETYMNEALASTENTVVEENTSTDNVDDYVNNVDKNYDKMMKSSQEADENDYVSNSEWAQVKESSIAYILGTMLSGSTDTELLSAIKENYEKSSYYQIAKGALEKLQNETDPNRVQELFNIAKENIEKLIDTAGKDEVVDAINDVQNQKEENRISQNLQTTVDSWLEANIKPDMTDEQKQLLKDFANSMISKYIETMSTQNAFDGLSDQRMSVMFDTYLGDQYRAFNVAQLELEVEEGEIEKAYNNLIDLSDAAKESGFVSNTEKAAIVSASVDLIYNQLLTEMDDIALLEALNPGYKNSAEYLELKAVVSELKTSFDPDEIDKLEKEAKELLSNLLNSYSGDELADSVDSIKPVQITDETKQNAITNSSISGDYYANVTRTSDKTKQKNGKDYDEYAAIIEMAKADLQAYAESMKNELKEQLGDKYNEEEIQKYINDAINDTIKMFSDNKTTQKNAKRNNYDVASDQYAFVFCKNNRLTKKGKYAYNLQALINAFSTKFNEEASSKQLSKIDPTLITYDRENVVADVLGNDYYYSKLQSFSLTKKDMPFTRNEFKEDEIEELRSQAIDEAKNKLKALGESLKASLRAEGKVFNDSDIDNLIDQSIQNIISNPDSFLSETLPKQRAGWALAGGLVGGFLTGGAAVGALGIGLFGGIAGSVAAGGGLGFGLNSTYTVSFDTKALADRFFDEFDRLYDEKRNQPDQ